MVEIGILVALFSTLTSSVRESVRKHVARDFTSVQIGFMTQVYGAIVLLPFAVWQYFKHGLPMTPAIAFSLLVSAGGVLTTTYIYVEAMRITDISVTEPLRQTSPIMVALLEPLILNIKFSKTVIAAALIGSIGSYILVSSEGLTKPIENLRNRGAAMAVVVALIFAFLAIAKRFGSTNINPLLFTYITYILGLFGFWLWKKAEGKKLETGSFLRKDVFSMGVVTIYAFSLISASEVTVTKQASAIFGILIGGRFFRETGILRKLIGAAIIIAGVAIVALL